MSPTGQLFFKIRSFEGGAECRFATTVAGKASAFLIVRACTRINSDWPQVPAYKFGRPRALRGRAVVNGAVPRGAWRVSTLSGFHP